MTQITWLIFQDVSRHTSSSRKVLIRSKKSDDIIETQSASLGAQLPIIYQVLIPQLLFFVYMFSQIKQMFVKDRGNIWTRKYGQHDCVHYYIHITEAYTCMWYIWIRKYCNRDRYHDVRVVVAYLDFHTDSSLKQLLVGGHVAPLVHVIHIPIQPDLYLHLNAACIMFKQKIQLDHLKFDPTGAQTHYLPHWRRTRELKLQRCGFEAWRWLNVWFIFSKFY